MPRKSNKQIEIESALRTIAEVEEIAQENQAMEGGREYRITWFFHYEKGSAGRALRTLKQHGQPCPDVIKRNFPQWSY